MCERPDPPPRWVIEHAPPALRDLCGGCRFAAPVAVGWTRSFTSSTPAFAADRLRVRLREPPRQECAACPANSGGVDTPSAAPWEQPVETGTSSTETTQAERPKAGRLAAFSFAERRPSSGWFKHSAADQPCLHRSGWRADARRSASTTKSAASSLSLLHLIISPRSPADDPK